ncbi:MAG: tryptophan synthase subunit alpha [Candidatus Puniceispirillales bacterium]
MRIARSFEKARDENRAALGIFVTAGDPDPQTAMDILLGLPDQGVDFVELGMPFSDPMADGPSIQASSRRALKAGVKLADVLAMATAFREKHPDVPLILMGYYNPIYIYGVDRFIADALKAGVDGMIMVDLPPEEDDEFCIPARKAGLDMIRLVTPTTNAARMPRVMANSSGFVYYVSITGITGTRSASGSSIEAAMKRIKAATELPAVVGFGIRSREQVAEAAVHADGVVVGSAIVDCLAGSLDENGAAGADTVSGVLALAADLAAGRNR